MPANTVVQLRKGTSSQWSLSNPVLASGEPGYDLTNNLLKIGDGINNWSNLNNHNHTSSNITDFASSVSGLLPVTNLLAGSYIGLSQTGSSFTVSATGLQPSEIGRAHV